MYFESSQGNLHGEVTQDQSWTIAGFSPLGKEQVMKNWPTRTRESPGPGSPCQDPGHTFPQGSEPRCLKNPLIFPGVSHTYSPSSQEAETEEPGVQPQPGLPYLKTKQNSLNRIGEVIFAPIIPACRRMRQENKEFKASLGYIMCSRSDWAM